VTTKERAVLSLINFGKHFGAGCASCSDNREGAMRQSYCPVCRTIYACSGISLELYTGEVLGIVGESGSGKSTLLRCLYFDEDATAGEAYLSGYKDGQVNVLTETVQQKRYIRNHHLGMVYQNPYHGLRMSFSATGNIAEKLIAAGSRSVGHMTARAATLLTKVEIPKYRFLDIPATFSGGMQQRVQIAKALSNNPPILLLDEITTGLDLSVQAMVLDLIKGLQRELGISMIVVSHDLAVIRMLAERTVVMKNGRIIEQGLTDQVLEDPKHPYTQLLVQSLL